jgi:beta-phosphoglucomutase-like phosphatase (HAD superfamily)
MLQAIILDFDGVIADTERLHLRAFQDVLGRRGIRLCAEDYYARYLGLDDVSVFRALARQRDSASADAVVAQMLREKAGRYAELIADSEVLFDGVIERVRAWSAEVPLAVASGSLRSEIEGILGRHDLLRCFTTVVSAEDVPRGKPAPDPYVTAVLRLRAAAPTRSIESRHVVAIEDSLPGVDAARAAGLRTVAVTTNQPADTFMSADLVVASIAALDLPTLARLAD